ncbi:MAG TPA: TetR/AcrR family transcriptional regulator [Actinomycetota bacterium]
MSPSATAFDLMAGPSTDRAVRPPGRPRSARADRAILEAALAAFVEQGFDGMSIEGVAERAGVGKTTIYRRWASKEELVAAAVGTLVQDVDVADTGAVREDVLALVRQLARLFRSRDAGAALPRMVGQVASGSPLGRAYVEQVIMPRRRAAAEALRRGIRRRELREDLDVELAVDQLLGPLIVRRLFAGASSLRRDLPEQIVDAALRGMRPDV